MCIRDRLKGIDLGISFYASPIFNKDLVELAKNKNVISMPGALSPTEIFQANALGADTVSYTHLRAHETVLDLVCRLLLEKKTI